MRRISCATLIAGASVTGLIEALVTLNSPALAQTSQRTQPIESFKALRDANLVRQVFDYSCGAASLATLITYGYGRPTTEAEVISVLLKQLDQRQTDLRRKEGFSLLDLKRAAEHFGFDAQGFELVPDALQRLSGPVIVYIRPKGYRHFAVLKGLRDGRVFLADPAQGNSRMSLERFLAIWLQGGGQGIVFAIEPRHSRRSPSALLAAPAKLFMPEAAAAQRLVNSWGRAPRRAGD